MFHLVKIKYNKEDEAGAIRIVTGLYLFDTTSWTETEALVARKQLTGDFVNELAIASITPYNGGEIVFNKTSEVDYLKWYRLRYYYITDTDKGTPKRVTGYMTIEAEDSKDALRIAASEFSSWLITPVVDTLTETKIEEIFLYEDGDKVIIEKG